MDTEIEESEIKGIPLTRLPDSSRTVQRFEEMLGRILHITVFGMSASKCRKCLAIDSIRDITRCRASKIQQL